MNSKTLAQIQQFFMMPPLDLEEKILEWLATPVVHKDIFHKPRDHDAECVVTRTTFCGLQVWSECLDLPRSALDDHWKMELGKRLRELEGWHKHSGLVRVRGYGMQRIYVKDGTIHFPGAGVMRYEIFQFFPNPLFVEPRYRGKVTKVSLEPDDDDLL